MLEQQLDVLVLEDALDLDRHRTARGWFAWRTANPNPRGSTLSGATAGVNPRNSPARAEAGRRGPLHENRCYVKSGRGEALALSRACRPDHGTTPLLHS